MTVSSVFSATSLYQPENQALFQQQAQDFNTLASALQSGNLSTAQSAFTSWQQDLTSIAPPNQQSTQQSQPFGSNSQANSDFQSLSSALQSGDISSAQQAFANLKQDLQSSGSSGSVHRHHHHHRTGTQNNSNTGIGAQGTATSAAATAAAAQAIGGTLNTQA
jgi:hypothetical protein